MPGYLVSGSCYDDPNVAVAVQTAKLYPYLDSTGAVFSVKGSSYVSTMAAIPGYGSVPVLDVSYQVSRQPLTGSPVNYTHHLFIPSANSLSQCDAYPLTLESLFNIPSAESLGEIWGAAFIPIMVLGMVAWSLGMITGMWKPRKD